MSRSGLVQSIAHTLLAEPFTSRANLTVQSVATNTVRYMFHLKPVGALSERPGMKYLTLPLDKAAAIFDPGQVFLWGVVRKGRGDVSWLIPYVPYLPIAAPFDVRIALGQLPSLRAFSPFEKDAFLATHTLRPDETSYFSSPNTGVNPYEIVKP